MINLCFDTLGPHNIGYPNLAAPNLNSEEFDRTWPRVLPLRLTMYLHKFKIPFAAHDVDHAPVGSWYPIALGWHDFGCDYFAMISPVAKERLKSREIRLLFYYHEGDHPGRIKDRFDLLCQQHDLPEDCYLFISSNSTADTLTNFRYFNDHEYFFSYINRFQSAAPATDSKRHHEFTALNRIHKWWRASVMADLRHNNVLDNSLWSYNTSYTIDDNELDNPLELDRLYNWRQNLSDFMAKGPYICDTADGAAHNDHRRINSDLYLNSYCHLVIETLFDVDGSGGAFLTEKTFKCIKFGQPFVIIGGPGSLEILRKQGYRVFDHAIDNDYDLIKNNTQRWFALRNSIKKIQQCNLHDWYLSCLDDVRHNQQVFESMSHGSLQRLAADLDTVK